MAALSRSKGARGELEFLAELGEWLGIDLKRNLCQVRDGGEDCNELPYAIEIKRSEQFRFAYIEQAVAQAEEAGKPPALAYRANRQDWMVLVPMSIAEFADLIRERMD